MNPNTTKARRNAGNSGNNNNSNNNNTSNNNNNNAIVNNNHVVAAAAASAAAAAAAANHIMNESKNAAVTQQFLNSSNNATGTQPGDNKTNILPRTMATTNAVPQVKNELYFPQCYGPPFQHAFQGQPTAAHANAASQPVVTVSVANSVAPGVVVQQNAVTSVVAQ